VRAASEGEGRGSRFTVTLPRQMAPSREAAIGASAPAQGAVAGPRRLLVVDDNTDAAETLADLLRMLGYEVRCAGDGKAAMALLEGYVPELTLLDIGLRGEDGYVVARRMREDPRLVHLKLVALTGYGADADRAQALAARFDEHLVKPVDAERLLEVLARLLPAA